jgi:uncharacterized protein YjiS (DUF1127 family)
VEAAVERTAFSKALITDTPGIHLLDASRRIIAAITAELCIRRDMRRVGALDDHRLEDIGMRRNEIEHCVRYGRDG